MKKIINPYDIPFEAFPVFVFSDDLRGFIPWAIRSHTKGSYSHAMMMVNRGMVVTQGRTYKEISIKVYMTGRHRLKFWQYLGLSAEIKLEIIEAIEKDLAAPWWRKRYDNLGIIGQLFKIPWINNPWTYFCTERVSKRARVIPRIKDIIPKHPSPTQLNNLFKAIPEMKVLGYWFKD